ncbi:hypothetical protein BDV06DRAFT_224840 [Aspergillus oleicola]
MALPTPPQTPVMTSSAPIPIPTAPRAATPIPTILRTSPPDETVIETYMCFAHMTPPLPPRSPPSYSSSESTTTTSSLTPPTPLVERDLNRNLTPINAFLKPIDAGLLSDSDISSLDLGPAHTRSATPSPTPSLAANLGKRPGITPDIDDKESHPSKDYKVRSERKRRDTAEKAWHARGQDKRRSDPNTDSSLESSLFAFSDSEGSSYTDDTSLERAGRDTETRDKSRKPVVRFSYANVRRSPRRAWHR